MASLFPETIPAQQRRPDSEFLTVAACKDLGWTDGAIKKFLGEPDDLAPNPVYKTAAPMRRYRRERVEAVMECRGWRDWYEKSKARRAKLSSTLAATNERKRQELIAQSVASLRAWFPASGVSDDAVVAYWYEQKSWFLSERQRDTELINLDIPDPNQVDSNTLARWRSNLLRHGYSNYDDVLEHLSGQVGHEVAYHALRREIDSSEGDPTRLHTDFSKPIGLPSHTNHALIQMVTFAKP